MRSPTFPAPETPNSVRGRSALPAVVVGSTEGETILAINNMQERTFDDIRVRQAISPTQSTASDDHRWGHVRLRHAHRHAILLRINPDLCRSYGYVSDYDPERAHAQLLAEAGHAEESDAAPSSCRRRSYARRGGEIIAAQLRDVGIETEISNLEWAQWLEQVFRGTDYDLTIVSHTEPADIGIYAREGYYFNYVNPEFNALMEELTAETDPARRSELNVAAQEMIAGGLRQRLPLPARRGRGGPCRYRRALAEPPDPGDGSDRRQLDPIRGNARPQAPPQGGSHRPHVLPRVSWDRSRPRPYRPRRPRPWPSRPSVSIARRSSAVLVSASAVSHRSR